MKRSEELRELRNKKLEKLQGILTNMAEESRSTFNEAEQSQHDTLRNEIRDLATQIESTVVLEEAEETRASEAAKAVAATAGGNPTGGSEKQEKRSIASKISLGRAIGMQLRGEALDGVEKEMRDEAAAEAAKFGKSVAGMGLPSFLVAPPERRAAPAAGSGGNTIATTMEGYTPVLRPNPRVLAMGARLRTGLTSNWEQPRKTAATGAAWEGETDAAAEATPTYDKITLTPKRLAAFTEVSRQLMIQSNIPGGIEADIREDLSTSIALALDLAAINGSGTAPVPRGILSTTGIGSVAIGTNGGALTRDHLIELQRAIAVENALVENMGFLSNPEVATKLMSTKLDAGSGRFILETMMGPLMGYNALFSTQVPNNLTKGTGTDLSAVIFGDFAQLLIGQWGGVDLVLDQYTKATEGMVRLVVNSYYDMTVRQPKAFAAIVDADASL